MARKTVCVDADAVQALQRACVERFGGVYGHLGREAAEAIRGRAAALLAKSESGVQQAP